MPSSGPTPQVWSILGMITLGDLRLRTECLLHATAPCWDLWRARTTRIIVRGWPDSVPDSATNSQEKLAYPLKAARRPQIDLKSIIQRGLRTLFSALLWFLRRNMGACSALWILPTRGVFSTTRTCAEFYSERQFSFCDRPL